MLLGIFTGVKQSLDLVTCKVMGASGLQIISPALMVTAFPTVPTYGLGFLLGTARGQLRPSCRSWLTPKLTVPPFLCPSLSPVPWARLCKGASGNYQHAGFPGRGMRECPHPLAQRCRGGAAIEQGELQPGAWELTFLLL